MIRLQKRAHLCAWAFLFVFSLSFSILAKAFDDPAKVALQGDTLVLITHATETYDARRTTEPGLSELLSAANGASAPVISLQDSREDQSNYFLPASAKLAAVLASGGGEFDMVNLKIPMSHVISAGGYFERCEFHSMLYLLTAWASEWARTGLVRNLKITHYADASYTYGDYVNRGGIPPSTNPRPRLDKIIARNGTTRSLREALAEARSAKNEDLYYQYVVSEWVEVMEKQQSAPLSGFIPNYNVQLERDGKVLKTLSRAKVQPAPTLTFQLITQTVSQLGADKVFGKDLSKHTPIYYRPGFLTYRNLPPAIPPLILKTPAGPGDRAPRAQ